MGAIAIDWHLEFDPLRAEWEELATRTAADPFHRPGWIEEWHRAFGGGSPMVAVARDDGRLVAVLPLLRTRSRLVSPTNWHTPVFGPVSSSERALQGVVEAVFAERPRGLILSFVDETDPVIAALNDAAAEARYRVLDLPLQRSPFLELDGDWEALWASLGSKRRNTLKRRRKKLEERGVVSLETITSGAAVSPALDEAFRVEALGWKGAEGTAIASGAETAGFYRRVAEWAAKSGLLRLELLKLDGRVVAFDYALEEGDRHYLLKTGFDPEYRDCAPGLVLRTMMIERACRAGIRSYEFLGGEDPYKLDWTEAAHERRRLAAFAPTPAGLASFAAYRFGRPAALSARRALRRKR